MTTHGRGHPPQQIRLRHDTDRAAMGVHGGHAGDAAAQERATTSSTGRVGATEIGGDVMTTEARMAMPQARADRV